MSLTDFDSFKVCLLCFLSVIIAFIKQLTEIATFLVNRKNKFEKRDP